MDLVEQQLPRILNRTVAAKSLTRDAARPQPRLEVTCTTAFNWSTSELAIIWDSTAVKREFGNVTVDGVIEIPATGWYRVDVQTKVARGGTYYILRAYKDSVTAANELGRDVRGAVATIAHNLRISDEWYLKKGESLVITRQASGTFAADVGVESNGSGHTRLLIRRVGV